MGRVSVGHNLDVFRALCAARGKWGLYLVDNSPDETSVSEVQRAVPWMTYHEALLLVCGHGAYLFDSQAEMEAAYWAVVGDDGPTKTNPYAGPANVYAATCGPDGGPLTENT